METTSLIALSRQGVLRRQLNVVANNIANMNTTGFKGEKMLFVQHLVRSRGGERLTPEKLAFVRDIATVRDLTEGPITTTGNPFDVAIRGDGYFVAGTPDGERFTRNGRFHLDPDRRLVTEAGDPVLSKQGAPISLGPTEHDIVVAPDGTISSENGVIGTLRVVRFQDEQAMQQISGGLLETTEVPTNVDAPKLVQHALEASNVEPIIEMTRMIEVHRAYASVNKMIESEDERMKKMIGTLATPAQG